MLYTSIWLVRDWQMHSWTVQIETNKKGFEIILFLSTFNWIWFGQNTNAHTQSKSIIPIGQLQSTYQFNWIIFCFKAVDLRLNLLHLHSTQINQLSSA